MTAQNLLSLEERVAQSRQRISNMTKGRANTTEGAIRVLFTDLAEISQRLEKIEKLDRS